MIEAAEINKRNIANNVSPLHSYEWNAMKQETGQQVEWFSPEDPRLPAIPIVVRQRFGVSFGWTPRGINLITDPANYKSSLKRFLRGRGIRCLFTYDDPLNTGKRMLFPAHHIPRSPKFETIAMDVAGVTDKSLMDGYNSTTRKHIRRAARLNPDIRPMELTDIDHFWESYSALQSANQFESPITQRSLKALFKIADCGQYRGLEVIANVLEHPETEPHYLMGLRYGQRLLEFLRSSPTVDPSKGTFAKLLTHSLLLRSVEHGVTTYDFGGTAPKQEPGIHQFKLGFGGEHIISTRLKIVYGC